MSKMYSVKSSDSGLLRSSKLSKHPFWTPDPPIALKKIHGLHSAPPLSKGGNPNFEKFKKGEPEKNFGMGETKRGRNIFKNKWGEPKFLS